jgi:hypothetical protein
MEENPMCPRFVPLFGNMGEIGDDAFTEIVNLIICVG